MEKKYTPTIGLEIHAEMSTVTKMFCGCKNNPDEVRPNFNICPVCMGHPGTLPVVNKQAVKNVLKVGIALGSTIADFTEFDRKNYFYPDIPKGYQISQYKFPLISGGTLDGVELTRIHLEEDTATSKHEEGDFSLVDYNRAGVPLMELVTEPVIHSPEQAGAFARELQLLLRTLGVGEANMEKGEMRVEANISVSEYSAEETAKDHSKFGTKVEVKNLNSFKAVEKAIAYEVKRHIALIEAGEKVVQETRGWDENKQSTFSQRKKENSHDYRYFPDPDIPKFTLSEIPEFSRDVLSKELPELPWIKRDRFIASFDLKKEEADVFLYNPMLGSYFEAVVVELNAEKKAVRLAANYILSDVGAHLKVQPEIDLALKIAPKNFASLMALIVTNKVSSRGAKDILEIMWKGERDGVVAKDADAQKIAEQFDLLQKSDEGALKEVLHKIISENPGPVADYKAGKQQALMFFVGQAMKATKGSANPELLKDIAIKVIAELQ